jgi:hypothetical protein
MRGELRRGDRANVIALSMDPTDALVEALMPIVFGSEPFEPLEHRHLRLVTPTLPAQPSGWGVSTTGQRKCSEP